MPNPERLAAKVRDPEPAAQAKAEPPLAIGGDGRAGRRIAFAEQACGLQAP